MTYKGKIKGNAILLDDKPDLPEGAEVVVDIVTKKKNLRAAFGVWKDRDDLDALTKEIYENRLKNTGKDIQF